MSMTLKLILSCTGIFIGGMVSFYTTHEAGPFNAAFWLGLAFGGLGPLGGYFIGLAQKAPWEGRNAQGSVAPAAPGQPDGV